MKIKKRLDVLLVERLYADTRSKAQAIIMSGNVYVNGQKADKPGVSYEETVDIEFTLTDANITSYHGALASYGANAVATLKQRVALLSGKYETTLAKMDEAIVYVNDAQKQIDRMGKDIKNLQDGFKAALNDNNKLKSETSSAFTMINEIQKKCDKAQNELANIMTVMKSKGEADEGQDVPDKSGDADGQTANDDKPKVKKLVEKIRMLKS